MEHLLCKLKNLTGINFDYYQRHFVEKRINFRVNDLKVNSYEGYLEYISTHPEELERFFEKFLINYTYFFRNYEIFERFEEFIKVYSKEMKRPLRIWSAPCATGDEPYSIAIILDKLKKELPNFPEYEIVASDFDGAALEIAQIGIYGEYSLHDTPKKYIHSYFSRKETPYGPKYSISPDIKYKVEYIEEDIINGHKKNIKYDVIFCRNFFIYINRNSRENLLKILENHLVDGGLLILGMTESLLDTSSSFKLIDNIYHFYVKNRLYHDFQPSKGTFTLQKHKQTKRGLKPNKTKKMIKVLETQIEKTKETRENVIFERIKEVENVKKEDYASIEVNHSKDDIYVQNLISHQKELEKRELLIIAKLNQLKILEEQLEDREIKLNQREVLIGLRETQIKHKIIQIEKREKNVEALEKLIEFNDRGENDGSSYKLAMDRVVKPNINGELNLPMGYYAIINAHDRNNLSTKFSVNALSSGIVLILKDPINEVYGMSHISKPKSRKNKNGTPIKYPHKFVDTSVQELLDRTLYHGADKQNVQAIIIGGAKNIDEKGTVATKNIDAIRNELSKHNIKIGKEFLGGICEISIIYNIEEDSLYLKKIWEDEYRKIN